MADEPRYSDEIRIPISITLPWSGRLTPNGKPWPKDAKGRDWPSRRGKPIFPIDQLPHGFAPGIGWIYEEGDGRRMTERFAAMDAAMREEIQRAGAAVRLIADRGPGPDAGAGEAAGPPEPTMSNQEAFDRGIASSPRDGAIRIPQDAARHLTGVPLLDSSGDPVKDANGIDAQTPQAFSAEFFCQRGLADAPLYADAIRDWKILHAVEPYSQVMPLTMVEVTAMRFLLDRRIKLQNLPIVRFGQQAEWDAQRFRSPKVMEQFRSVATIYIGIYAAAAGIPRDMI